MLFTVARTLIMDSMTSTVTRLEPSMSSCSSSRECFASATKHESSTPRIAVMNNLRSFGHLTATMGMHAGQSTRHHPMSSDSSKGQFCAISRIAPSVNVRARHRSKDLSPGQFCANALITISQCSPMISLQWPCTPNETEVGNGGRRGQQPTTTSLPVNAMAQMFASQALRGSGAP